jgi:hypothetical protein
MEYETAKKLLDVNKHLIGKSHNGGTINDVIIIPTDPYLASKFSKLYLTSSDPFESIQPFINEDVEVRVVLLKRPIFLTTNIFELNKTLGVITLSEL